MEYGPWFPKEEKDEKEKKKRRKNEVAIEGKRRHIPLCSTSQWRNSGATVAPRLCLGGILSGATVAAS